MSISPRWHRYKGPERFLHRWRLPTQTLHFSNYQYLHCQRAKKSGRPENTVVQESCDCTKIMKIAIMILVNYTFDKVSTRVKPEHEELAD